MGDVITYEELFDILRRERTQEDLQILSPDFYNNLVKYLEEKMRVLEDTSDEAQLFGSSDKENVKVQLENAKKITKELIERRQKKVISLALNKARTGSDMVDTTALLDVEKELLFSASDLFSDYKIGVLNKIMTLRAPEYGSDSHKVEKTVPETTSEAVEQETKKEIEVAEKPAVKFEKRVRFKAAVPKFLGKNAEIFGPYQEGEEAVISPEIAEILITKGRAEEI